MNNIQTWKQGKYIDHKKYSHMLNAWKHDQEIKELTLVRPSSEGNAICQCANPEDAKWIASRLNLASELEQLAYDYVTGKCKDDTDLIMFVKSNLEKI